MLNWATTTILYFIKIISAEEISVNYPEEEIAIDENNVDMGPGTEPPLRSEKEFDQKVILKKTKPEPCDYELWYYNLVHYPESNLSSSGYKKVMTDDCSRPFIVEKILSSNMILVVVNAVCWVQSSPGMRTAEPVQVDYNMSLACYRVLFNNFTRRHYMTCINRNANESEIKLCGLASIPRPFSVFALILICVYLLRV